MFSSHFLSSSSWANTHLNRGMLSGEMFKVYYTNVHLGGAIRMRLDVHWAVEAYMSLWTKEEGGQGSAISKGK